MTTPLQVLERQHGFLLKMQHEPDFRTYIDGCFSSEMAWSVREGPLRRNARRERTRRALRHHANDPVLRAPSRRRLAALRHSSTPGPAGAQPGVELERSRVDETLLCVHGTAGPSGDKREREEMDEREVKQYTNIAQGISDAMRHLQVAGVKFRQEAARWKAEMDALAARINAHLAREILAERRSSIGGNGSDAYDPLWQSASCGAWLHESCPDFDRSLACSCRCHR